MVLTSVTILAGLSAIMSTGSIVASADPQRRPGPGSHKDQPGGVETATYFVTVPVYPETTAPPPAPVTVTVTQIVSVTQAITVPAPVEPSPATTLSFTLTTPNSTVDLPTNTGSGNVLTTFAPTVCPGLDETILETIWTTFFNTVTATAIV